MSSRSRRPLRLFALVSSAALLFAATLPVEAVRYVDRNNAGCSDVGPGTQAEPYCTIQRGYDGAADGEQVRVLPGTYEECVVAFDMAAPKNVEIVADAWLQVPPDNTVTIVEAPGHCREHYAPVNISGRGPTGSKFQGFTVRNGIAGGIFGAGSVAITNNVVANNAANYNLLVNIYAGFGQSGGGIYVYSANCFLGDTVAKVAHNDVRNNTAFVGGGVAVGVGSTFFFPGRDCDLVGEAMMTVEDNTVTSNSTENGFGGGIYSHIITDGSRAASVVITRNMIEGNVAGTYVGSTGYGGGIYIWSSGIGRETFEVTNNVIRGNHGDHTGGLHAAVFPVYGWTTPSIDQRVIIEDNTISGNTADRGGAGMYLFLRPAELNGAETIDMSVRHNTITGNSVLHDEALSEAALPFHGGGGIAAIFVSQRSSSPNVRIGIENNEICDNSSKMFGGGVSLQAMVDPNSTAQIDLAGNLICRNDVSSDVVDSTGGGVFAYLEAESGGTARVGFDLNTIAGNTLDNVVESGGIHAESLTLSDGLAALTVTNSIVADNDGVGYGGPVPGTAGVLTPGGTGNVSSAVHYSDLFGNDFDHASWVGLGTGNIFVDPLFVDSGAGNFHLAQGSPAIDAGDPALASTATDADGDPRVADGDGDGTAVVDMGYDESVGGAIAIAIDIKPGDFPNVVNLRSRGVIPVAILGSAGFDVTTLDVTTLRFGPGEAAPVHDLLDPATYEDHLQDVNLDGYVDLMTHYETRAAGIDCEATEAALIGRTLSGQSVRGTDSIAPQGCRYAVRPAESDERIREIREGTTVEIAPR